MRMDETMGHAKLSGHLNRVRRSMTTMNGKPGVRLELPVVRKMYDAVVWFIPILNRFPKTHARGLGDRMIGQMYGLMDRLLRTRHVVNRVERLDEVLGELEILQVQIRLCADFGLMDADRYAFASKLVQEIVTDAGKWRKHAFKADAKEQK